MTHADPHADPHAGQPVLAAGAPLEGARLAMIMIHGRGASADDILGLAGEFRTADVAYLAPQAQGGVWYPFGFMSPIDRNEPGISSAMEVIRRMLDDIAASGIPRERTLLLGFSQGACLSTEFMARHAGRYGGLAALSGGLIGPDDTPRDYAGSLAGTPAFFGCSDVDHHIPAERVRDSAAVYQRLGAEVTMRLYEGMGHTINRDEISQVIGLIDEARDG